MTEITRPQALGAFDLPAGLLLVTGPDSDPVRQALLGGRLPTSWPASTEGVRLAHGGQLAEAAAWFAGRPEPANLYNRWVLEPQALRREDIAAALGPTWRPLVDYVAFALGLTSIPPSSERTDGELAALLATAEAAAALEAGNRDQAIALLTRASHEAAPTHPALAGVVLAELAGHTHDLATARRAVKALRGTALDGALAEAWYQFAGISHSWAIDHRTTPTTAISGYTDALAHVSEATNRALFARIHLGLGTAYLATPVTGPDDALRAAIAVQSLRTAARLLDRATEPQEWATARLNLANALVYAPSAHQRDNIMEAVDLYETVIQARRGRPDPAALARVLANQGNALAHLGLRDDARGRLDEAAALFDVAGDADAAAQVRQMEAGL